MKNSTHIVDEGSGPVTVLVHGVGLDLTMWDALVPSIQQGRRIVRYDMAGHGGSDRFGRESTLRDFCDQLDEVVEGTGAPDLSVVGFSMGAMVALVHAAAHPRRVSDLVLLHSVYARSAAERAAVGARLEQARSDGPSALIDAALSRWFTPEFVNRSSAAVEAVRHRLQSNDPDGFLDAYRVFATADVELPEASRAVRCRTLVMTGALDSGSSPDMSVRLAEDIVDAETRIWPGLAHLGPIEGATEVGRLLDAFLPASASLR